MLANSFLGRMENDLRYRGGTEEQVNAVKDKKRYAAKLLEVLKADNEALYRSFDRYSE